MSRRLDQPLNRGVRLKDKVTCAHREKDIGKEAVFLDDIRRRQPRDGTDIGKYIRIERLCRSRGKLASCTNDPFNGRRVPLVDDTICRKGIRLDCLRSRTQVLRMDFLDDTRGLDVRELHALAACMRLLSIIGAHAAVKDERLFFQMFPYCHALLAHVCSASLRYPSTRRAISTMLRASPA